MADEIVVELVRLRKCAVDLLEDFINESECDCDEVGNQNCLYCKGKKLLREISQCENVIKRGG